MTRNRGRKFELVRGPSVEAGLHGLGLKPPSLPPTGAVLAKGGSQRRFARFEALAHGLVDLGAIAPFVRRQRHNRIADSGINRQHAINRLFRPFPPQIEGVLVHYRSSRRPLKNGCRTFPSADFARYSISASNDGSTQIPRCAIFLAYGCVLRMSGLRRTCRSFADAVSNP